MNVVRGFLLLACLLAGGHAHADQYRQFGDYQVHYIVFNSTEIAPEIARSYGIERSGRLAFINVSLLRAAPGELPEGVAARVAGTATNLIQQQRELAFREIRERGAVYYIATLAITNEEIYRFELRVTPRDGDRTFTVRFDQKVWTEEAP